MSIPRRHCIELLGEPLFRSVHAILVDAAKETMDSEQLVHVSLVFVVAMLVFCFLWSPIDFFFFFLSSQHAEAVKAVSNNKHGREALRLVCELIVLGARSRPTSE